METYLHMEKLDLKVYLEITIIIHQVMVVYHLAMMQHLSIGEVDGECQQRLNLKN